MDNNTRNAKLALVLGIGVAFFVLLLFILPVGSRNGSGMGMMSGNQSSFPWIIFVVMIPAIIVPIMIAVREKQDNTPTKPKKEKRKPQYMHDASGENLEIIEEDEDSEQQVR